MTQDAIQLPDGRMLYYNLFGPANGQPVLYFHGTPSSRLEPLMPSIYGIDIISLLHQHQLQLIAIDRPGMGFSTIHPESSYLSFANDVAVLLSSKNIKRCPVLCWSGGGPYALAMAHQFPEIIIGVYIIAGFSISMSTPGLYEEMNRNKFYFSCAKNTPLVLEGILNYLAKKEIKSSFPQIIAGMPDVDYQYLEPVPYLKQLASITLQEACRYGSAGAVREAASYFCDFGFSLASIHQPVHYWWGAEDVEVIDRHPLAIAQELPNHKLYIKRDEGHISIYLRYIEEVLEVMAGSLKA